MWERPPELAGRPDVAEMLKSPSAAEKQKKKTASKEGGKADASGSDSDSDGGAPASKKAKKEETGTRLVFADEEGDDDEAKKGDGEVVILQETKKPAETKSAAMEAEVKAARERALIPLDTRMKQFRDLLTEKEISAFSTWEKELHKIVFDPRYLLLTSKERKSVFDKYVRERADEERREKKNRMKERKEAFRQLLADAKLGPKSSYGDFANKYGKNERFKGVDKSRDRESLFNEYVMELRKKEKEERVERERKARKDFFALLKESSAIVDRHSHWSDVKKQLDSDPRYKAVDSGRQREDWFHDHLHDLKEEHRREKDKKKKDRKRSRSRSRKRSRSRSRSRSKEGKSKKKKKDRSRSRERKKEKKDKEKDKEKEKEKIVEKEEGEMSEDEDEKSKARTSRSHSRDDAAAEKEADANGQNQEGEQQDDDETKEDRERREKDARAAASIRKREEEVQRERSQHLRDRDKEREQHRRTEAVSNFQALLIDLIRQPDFTWKEAKKMLKKDARYDSVTSLLDKSERERCFDDHIDSLVAKKKDNYWRLLDECKEITLTTHFKDIKNLIRDDPRYAKYSSSDRKCQKQFNEYMHVRSKHSITNNKQTLCSMIFFANRKEPTGPRMRSESCCRRRSGSRTSHSLW